MAAPLRAERRWRRGRRRRISQGELIGALNEAARPGDTIIAAAGGPPGDLQKLWDATGGRHCHLEFGFSCMGYELPAALGVRLAQPEGEVNALIGDGTFLMNPTELATAAQEGLKVTVVISDNHGFQVIRRLQMTRTGRHFGNEMRFRAGSLGAGRSRATTCELDLGSVARGLGATVFAAARATRCSTRSPARARPTGRSSSSCRRRRTRTCRPPACGGTSRPPPCPRSHGWRRSAQAYEEGLATQRWHG